LIRGSALLIAATLAPAVVDAQEASFTTSGGVARLDQSTAGAVGALTATAGGSLGPLGVHLVGNTVNYQSLGTANRASASLQFHEAARGWRVTAGPTLDVGSGVVEPWNHAWSGAVTVGRTLGLIDLQVHAAEGIALPGDQRMSFGRRGARAGVELGAVEVYAGFDLTTIRDSTLRDDVFFDPTDESLYRRRVRDVQDATVMVAIDLAAVDVRATVGRRSGDDIATQSWWLLEAALPIAQAAAVTFSTSRHPADVVLGLRGGRATTLGLRLALPDEAARRDDRFPARVEVSREDPDLVRVVFTLPGGSRARLMGEITGWRAVELESLGRGRFAAWFRAGEGTYRINVALDDGPWIAPPGMPRVEDGFGGLVGLLEL
jgi:hypothetical protein